MYTRLFFKWLHTMEYYQTVQFFAPWIQAWALTACIVQLVAVVAVAAAAFVVAAAASLHVDTLADVVPGTCLWMFQFLVTVTVVTVA